MIYSSDSSLMCIKTNNRRNVIFVFSIKMAKITSQVVFYLNCLPGLANITSLTVQIQCSRVTRPFLADVYCRSSELH